MRLRGSAFAALPQGLAVLPFENPRVPAGPDLSGYLSFCALVLGLVALGAWLFRRFVAGNLRARASKRSLQIVDALPLGGRQRLLVVRCYDQSFLIGQGDKELRTLAELDAQALWPVGEPEPAAAVEAAQESAAREAGERFAEHLRAPLPARRERAPAAWPKDGHGVLG